MKIEKMKMVREFERIAPISKIDLCTDCQHASNCSLKTDESVVFNCEEYQPELKPIKQKTLHKEHSLSASIMGLCNSCDFIKTCSLRQPESVIFNCEHYQ